MHRLPGPQGLRGVRCPRASGAPDLPGPAASPGRGLSGLPGFREGASQGVCRGPPRFAAGAFPRFRGPRRGFRDGRRASPRVAGARDTGSPAPSLFECGLLTGPSPQMCEEFSVHSLGTGKLSILRPQGALPILHQARSGGWGFVVNDDPQPVDNFLFHSGSSALSTGGPQVGPSCPQLLHTPVHCSATQHTLSPPGVKGVTPRRGVGLWGTGVKLGTALGRSSPLLCIGCAELSAVHR